MRGDGFFQAAHLFICQIIAAFDGHIVPVLGGTSRDEEERRLRAVNERKARLFHGFGNGERPARLDQARARLGDAEVFIVAAKRHALALFQRQDAVVLQKYDAFVRNALGGEFVFLMSAVVRARRGRFDLEGHGGELAPAFALVAAQLDRVSLAEFVRLLSHGQKEDGQGGLEQLHAFSAVYLFAVHRGDAVTGDLFRAEHGHAARRGIIHGEQVIVDVVRVVFTRESGDEKRHIFSPKLSLLRPPTRGSWLLRRVCA